MGVEMIVAREEVDTHRFLEVGGTAHHEALLKNWVDQKPHE